MRKKTGSKKVASRLVHKEHRKGTYQRSTGKDHAVASLVSAGKKGAHVQVEGKKAVCIGDGRSEKGGSATAVKKHRASKKRSSREKMTLLESIDTEPGNTPPTPGRGGH